MKKIKLLTSKRVRFFALSHKECCLDPSLLMRHRKKPQPKNESGLPFLVIQDEYGFYIDPLPMGRGSGSIELDREALRLKLNEELKFKASKASGARQKKKIISEFEARIAAIERQA